MDNICITLLLLHRGLSCFFLIFPPLLPLDPYMSKCLYTDSFFNIFISFLTCFICILFTKLSILLQLLLYWQVSGSSAMRYMAIPLPLIILSRQFNTAICDNLLTWGGGLLTVMRSSQTPSLILLLY
jgi:hypothetical protein